MELAERPVSKNASVSFFVCARQKGIMEITAETVETWDKASDLTDNIFRTPCMFCEEILVNINAERCRAIPERVGPRILSPESFDYYRTSECLRGRTKRRIFKSNSSMVRLVVGCCKLLLYANESCDKHAVYFRR